MKSEHFRIKKKTYEYPSGKAQNKPTADNLHVYENMTDPGQFYGMQPQYTQLQLLAQQIVPLNQGPFKLDQRLLQRLHSYGAHQSSQAQFETNALALSDFLQVKSVAFINQDNWNKLKTVATKQNRQEDSAHNRTIKSPPKGKKLPSYSEHDVAREDEEYRKRNSCEMKFSRETDTSSSCNQGFSKISTQEYQIINMGQDRSQSESPVQGKSGRIFDTPSQKTDRRHNSSTPRKETPSKAVRADAFGGRFGPLEQIQEFSIKKPANGYNSKNINQTKSYQLNNSNNINNNNRNKMGQPNIIFVESRGEKVTSAAEFSRSFLNSNNNNKTVLPSTVNPGLICNNNTQNYRTSPPSKIPAVNYNSSSYKPANAQKDGINSIQAEIESSMNGINRALLFNPDISSGVRRFQANQQNKNGRMLNTNTNLVSYQQPNLITSNYVLTAVINQVQPLIQNQIVSSLMSNGSTMNLKQVYPTIKIEEQPRKRVVYVPPPQSNKLKYYVGAGNNSALVKRVLAKRDWWEETEFFGGLFNLKWQQTFRGYKYDRLPDKFGGKQLVNHFEFHPEISTKDKLIKNLSTFCDTNKVHLFEMTPVTFCFDMDDTANFDRDIQKFAKFFIKHHPDPKKYTNSSSNDKKSQQVWFNFDYRKNPKYMHPAPHPERKLSPFVKPVMHKTFLKNTNAWIMKPVGLNRGRGIEVFNSLETLNELMNECFQPSPPKKKGNNKKEEGNASGSEDDEEDLLKKELSATSRTFVVQKYIEDVLLINKRKFDIRVWTVVTHDMQLYFFKEGYLRTSSEEFSLEGSEVFNKFIHLTNNAVQKFSNGYGQHEHGNQLSFKDFEEYMIVNGLEGDFRGKILPRMKELVKNSMLSVHKMLNMNDRKYCFEVFGYDFMIDVDFNVWLIEVNTNPCLDESSPLLQMLIPRMVDDAFKLTVDVIFPKNIKKTNPQSPLKSNSNVKPTIKEEGQETKPVSMSLNLKEIETDEKKSELHIVNSAEEQKQEKKSEEDKQKIELAPKTHVSDIENYVEISDTDKNIEKQNILNKAELSGVQAEAAVKEQQATAKTIKLDETLFGNKESNFSVEGYNDNENMWEFLCSLYVPKSPVKRDNKAR